MSKSDVIISNFFYVDDVKKTKQILNNFESIQYNSSSFKKDFCRLLYETCAVEACWNKLYKTDTVIKCNARFDEDINYGEDLLFNLSLYKSYDNIFFLGEPLYNYYVRKKKPISLSQKYRKNLLFKELHLLECIKKFLIETEINHNRFFYKYMEEHMIEGINEYRHQQCNLDTNQINAQLSFIFNSDIFLVLPNSVRESLKKYAKNVADYNKI